MPGQTPSRTMLLCALVMLILITQAALGGFALWRSQAADAGARDELARLTQRLDTARIAEVAFKVQVQEWKNILLRGFDPGLRARHQAAFLLQERGVDEALQRLGPRAGPLRDAHATVNALYSATLADARLDTAEGVRAADAEVRGVDRALQTQLEAFSEAVLREHQAAERAADESAAAHYAQLAMLLNLGAGAGLLAALLLLFLVTRR